MAKPFVIVGGGAIGGTLGAHLIRAGHAVLLVDTNIDHVMAINQKGLTIEGRYPAFTVATAAVTPDQLRQPIERAVIAVKTLHTRAALDVIAPLLTDDGFVVAMQNGIGVLDIADRVGNDRTVVAAFTFGGLYKEPGTIVFSSPASFRIGNLNGSRDPRLAWLCDTFSALQPVEISDNILGFVWAKTVLGAIYFASALVDADVCDQIDRPQVRALFGAIAGEIADTAEAEAVRLESFDGFHAAAFARHGWDKPAIEASWQGQRDYWSGHVQQRTGIWRDLAVHKRKTEAEPILGRVLARAHARGLGAPLLERLIRLIADVETGRRRRGWALFDELGSGVESVDMYESSG